MKHSLDLGLDTFGDVTLAPGGGLLSHAQTIRNIIEEGILADSAGVHCFGVGEHHRAEFAVSAPEIVLAAIASRTRNIRLSTAVTVLSSDDPVRVFQRFSTLSAAANGRAEVILGRGSFTESFPLFGYELSQYGTLFDEKLDLFAALTRRHKVTWKGALRPPLTNQPVYPPIEAGVLKTWIGVGATPESVLRAARYGFPMMLGISSGDAQRFKPFVELYNQACEKLGRPAQPIGVQSNGHIAETDDQARDSFWRAYKPIRDQIGAERGLPPISKASFEVEVDRGSLYVGSPETVARKIAKTVQVLGLSRFNMKYSNGRLSHELLCFSIELYGKKVIPMVFELLS